MYISGYWLETDNLLYEIRVFNVLQKHHIADYKPTQSYVYIYIFLCTVRRGEVYLIIAFRLGLDKVNILHPSEVILRPSTTWFITKRRKYIFVWKTKPVRFSSP